MPTVDVEGSTSATGAVTGRHYRIPAGETKRYRGPEGEFETFPSNRVTVLDETHSEDRITDPGGEDLFSQETSGEGEVGDDEAEEEAPDIPDEGRAYTASGSWKTLYEAAEEVATVRCGKEEADAWVSGDTTLDELQS